ncbi:MAG: hypothetical protein LLG40_15710 [Deltaproteobacteria bacterium]|nr:hypothetical protein [Deltaproteobacteria bacterium]
MYFKIEKSGCNVFRGKVQVRADFYRDEEDEGYALTPVKIIPDGGYPGEVDENGHPVTKNDYQAWFDSLSIELRNLPFHIHFIYFDYDIKDEEILFCFELALDWFKKGLPIKNLAFSWSPDKSDLSALKISEILDTDFSTVNNANIYSVK